MQGQAELYGTCHTLFESKVILPDNHDIIILLFNMKYMYFLKKKNDFSEWSHEI